MPELDFFINHYKALRPSYTPMQWMKRMYLRLISGQPPSLVDLPTGAGKTDLVVIWLVALAWYAKHRGTNHVTAKAVPRRLIWVVNRRVLVQQVFDVAEGLNKTLKSEAAAELAGHLRSLCKQNSEAVFNVVQLRGQRLDDREWSLDPTMPQLIIGTVDQIGSRLLFQGYGLGKWSRPMHAGLFGVDAWVCVDEAHLVPAFAVTLRQIREIACRPLASVPECVAQFFAQLPFWITELSATPGLPPPKHDMVFLLEKEDETDEIIADRLLAKKTRVVIWKPQPEKKHLARDMAAEALQIAKDHPGSAIGVFCRTVQDAEAISKTVKVEYKDRVLLVTGRIRGYERDRLKQNQLFRRFRQGHPEGPADTPPTFLIGTAAAEVGLDADASAIVCDFADMLTLIQRLGRLDRRGQLSKRAKDANTPPPTMTIIGGSNGETSPAQLTALAEKLGSSLPANGFEYGANFFTGAPWSVVVGKDKSDEDDDANEAKGKTPGIKDAIASATWQALALPVKSVAAPASGEVTAEGAAPTSNEPHYCGCSWLQHPLAAITAGPVVVPPLTDAVLKRWAATTPGSPKFLPVHPWLYGLLPDDEGTPLVGIAFRLELDILQHCRESDEDDGDTDQTWEKIEKCLTVFPPLNSELHFVPVSEVRKWLEWLKTIPNEQRPAMAHFDGEEWTNFILPDELNSNSVLMLPTSTLPSVVKDFVENGGDESESQRCWDVFEALAEDGARYRRTVTTNFAQLKPDQNNEQSVYRVPEFGAEDESAKTADEFQTKATEEHAATVDETKWKAARTKLSFVKNGISFELSYFRPRHNAGSGLDLLPDHLYAAAEHGGLFAKALAPDNAQLAAMLSRAAADHDKGKGHAKWQQAMGNTPSWRKAEGHDDTVLIAKPVIENPGNAGGYRHEWGTLWRIKDNSPAILPEADAVTEAFIHDLYLHGIAAHHGYFRPSMPDRGFYSPPTAMKQNPLRLEAIERSIRLQRQLGYWRLAYLESLIKIADVAASRDAQTEESDDES